MGQRWKFIVWYLAQSATHQTFTQLPPGHRTCLLISHLNSPGSIQLAQLPFPAHRNYSNTQAFAYSWVERVHVWVKALPRTTLQRHSKFTPPSDSNLISLVCKSPTLPSKRQWYGLPSLIGYPNQLRDQRDFSWKDTQDQFVLLSEQDRDPFLSAGENYSRTMNRVATPISWLHPNPRLVVLAWLITGVYNLCL